MNKYDRYGKRSIKYFYDPYSSVQPSSMLFDNDLFLFSVTSESFPLIPKSGLTIIGGRSVRKPDLYGQRLLDVIHPDERDLPLFFDSLFRTRESVAVFPLGRKVLAVYNKLLRSSGLGIAFIFNYSPRCVSAILASGCTDAFESIIFSDSFNMLSKTSKRAMDFIGSLSYNISRLEERGIGNRACIDSAVRIISAASDIIGCPAIIELGVALSCERRIDATSLSAICLGIFSVARRISKDRSAKVKVFGENYMSISVEFELSASTDIRDEIYEISFCDRAASEAGLPFRFSIDGMVCRSFFIPLREDPSLLGFKSGIFIDGKRFIPPPL